VIVCRSAAELERMHRAGHLVGEVLMALAARVAPGVTTAELDELAEKKIMYPWEVFPAENSIRFLETL